MKRTFPAWSGYAMALLVPMWLLSVTASAQSHQSGGSSGGSSSGSSGSSGGSSSGGGGGGGGTSHSGGGGSHNTTGVAVARGGDSSGGGGHIGGGGSMSSGVSRGGDGGSHVGDSGSRTGARATYRGDSGSTRTTNSGGDAVPPYARPRGDRPAVGTAVERTGAPPVPGGRTGGTVYVPGGYYPWGYGGIGLGGYGYYGGYYDPFYDPWDPWYGAGYGGYGGYGSYPQYNTSYGEGSLRLKIKPRDATVYVDGYYVGTVDDFDGLFQRLHIEAGRHRIEVRAPGYEPLTFEVRLTEDQTTTYTGELKKIQ